MGGVREINCAHFIKIFPNSDSDNFRYNTLHSFMIQGQRSYFGFSFKNHLPGVILYEKLIKRISEA